MPSELDADVIVVGAGCAGSAAAYTLAKRGHSVIQIERGGVPGEKNLSGGVLYTQGVKAVFDDVFDTAPVERQITRNVIWFLNPTSGVAVDYRDEALTQNAVTVLRAKFDRWMSEQCENAGVMLMPGVRVDAPVREGGRVVGVTAGGDTLRASYVIAADGVNSFLARSIGLRKPPAPSQLALGVKSVIRLGASTIEERFGVAHGEGAAFAVVGDCTQGVGGGGFLYTNIDTVSIGVVLRLDDLVKRGLSSSDVHDQFLNHRFVAPYLAGGELLEYGCHLVAEGGQAMVEPLGCEGMLVAGDAAGFTLNTGLTVRGMDLALQSGLAAALAVSNALAGGEALGEYRRLLGESFVLKDMSTYAKAPAFLEREGLYGAYGQLAASLMRDVFRHDGTGRRHLLKVALRARKASGVQLRTLASDALAGLRAL